MRSILATLLAIVLIPAVDARAQDGPFRVEPLKDAPPDDLAAAIRETLQDQGYSVLDGQGKPYARFWLRKAIPAASKPAGPKGAVLYPFLAEGELLGAFEFVVEGYDYRDQPIEAGPYTLRYGLQPVDGNHLGVSPHRDYALLLPANADQATEPLGKAKLEDQSAEAAGSSHPAVLMLDAVAEGQASGAIVHDEGRETWGVVLPLPLNVEGESAPVPQNILLIVVGAAPV